MGAPLQRGAGSGVVIDDKGFIPTNNHVVGGADEIKVQFQDGKELPAKIVGTDPRSDPAVISVRGRATASKPLRLVIRSGWPSARGHGDRQPVRPGPHRHGWRDQRQKDGRALVTVAGTIRTFCRPTHRSTRELGGPLVNLNGEVIGINTAILGPGGNIGIGFAVPGHGQADRSRADRQRQGPSPVPRHLDAAFTRLTWPRRWAP